MNEWSDLTEEELMAHLRRTVKQKEMPQESYANQIMERLNEMSRSSRSERIGRGTWKKKTAISVTAAAMLGGVVMGSGFVSPVMADALKTCRGSAVCSNTIRTALCRRPALQD